MKIQTTDLQSIVLGKRDDRTFDGELEIKVIGGGKITVPFYVEKHEDHNPPRKETS